MLTSRNESTLEFVSSRGILKSCDWFSLHPQSSIRYMKDYPQLPTSSVVPVIYVCSSSVTYFKEMVLTVLKKPFILVGGDCDETIPNDIFQNEAEFQQFVENPYLVHWFSQNLVRKHPKMTNIPIGLDYHTMASSPVWGPVTSPYDQEALIKTLKNTALPFWERKMECYANFHFLMTTKHGYDRKDAFKSIDKKLVFYEPTHIPRADTWKAQREFAFVICPHGGGYDCHRLWEALILGCIPIVKKSNIDELYQDLPVLKVDRWEDITEALLLTTVDCFKERKDTFKYEKLTLKYWMEKIRKLSVLRAPVGTSL